MATNRSSMTEDGYCPILKVDFQSKTCPIETCVYREEATGRCKHLERTENLPENQDDRTTAVCTMFRVTPAEMVESQTRIREALEANRFFEYLYGKPITEAKAKDIQEMAGMADKYEAWNGKESFNRIVAMAQFIATKL